MKAQSTSEMLEFICDLVTEYHSKTTEGTPLPIKILSVAAGQKERKFTRLLPVMMNDFPETVTLSKRKKEPRQLSINGKDYSHIAIHSKFELIVASVNATRQTEAMYGEAKHLLDPIKHSSMEEHQNAASAMFREFSQHLDRRIGPFDYHAAFTVSLKIIEELIPFLPKKGIDFLVKRMKEQDEYLHDRHLYYVPKIQASIFEKRDHDSSDSLLDSELPF